MHRRRFLAASLATSAMGLSQSSIAQTAAPAVGAKGRQFYSLRRYTLLQGSSQKVTESFVGDALIPALNRLGIAPVGAFRLSVGPETPTLYLLMPSTSLETLVTADLRLADDAAFMTAAAPFWSGPASNPPFLRCESSVSVAFEGFPNLVAPAKGKRIFQLRTYESPTYAAHVRKVEMFHKGEFDIFRNAGCAAVFYADNLIGKRLPSLTYMLTFPDQAALDAGWAKFGADPEWKKLQANPRYTDQIVNSIDNLILTPTATSQI